MDHQCCSHPITINFTTVTVVLLGLFLAAYHLPSFQMSMVVVLLATVLLFCNRLRYSFKWTWAFLYLYFEQRWLPKRMNNYNITSSKYEDVGYEATVEEKGIDKPRQLHSEDDSDSMFIYGSDRQGNAVVLKLVRKYGRTVETWVHIQLEDGKTFQLPGHPDTTIYNTDGKTFSAAGLRFSVFHAMRKWRVTFNGLLREGTHHSWSEQSEDVIHVKFNFIWSALFPPYDRKKDCSPALMADSFAKANWFSCSGKGLCESGTDEYEQWGALHGTMTVGGKEEIVMYLRGIRQHSSAVDKRSDQCSSIDVYGYIKDGTVFTVGTSISPNEFIEAKHGHIVIPKSIFRPVVKCDLQIGNFTENALKSGNVSLKFQGKDMWYNCILHPEHEFVMYSGRPWKQRTNCVFVKYFVNGKEGIGIVKFTDRYDGDCPLPAEASLPLLSQPKLGISDVPLLLKFSDAQCCSRQIVGGKAANLALLSTVKSEKFSVPRSICITVNGFQSHLLSNPSLQEALVQVEDVAWGGKEGNLKETCDRVSELITHTSISSDLQKAIENTLPEVFPHDCELFAVRSSAVSEDSDEVSAAGQNESLLGCKAITGILQAVVNCWASAFAFQSVEYRRQHGLPIQQGVGVVIQEMIPADTAGVLFTCDPVTGNPEYVVITANFGLGESVVSGSVATDTIILRQKPSVGLEVHDKTLGHKQIKTVLEFSGGTKQEDVKSEEASSQCLPDNMALQLGTTGILLEKMFGISQDIEWAIVGDKIYLLQARTITTLHTWTDFEILHEFDEAVLTDHEHYTRANLGEVLTGAQTPLTHTFIKSVDTATQIMREDKLVFEYQTNVHKSMFFCLSQYQYLLNMFDLFYSFIETEKDISLMQNVIDIAVFGHIVTTPSIHQMALERNGVMSALQNIYLKLDVMLETFWKNALNKNTVSKFEKFTVTLQGQNTAQEIYEKITQSLPVHLEIASAHMRNTHYSVMSEVCLLGILTNEGKEWCEHTLADIAYLLSFCTGLESADVPSALEALAYVIIESKESNKFLNMTPSEATEWLALHSGMLGVKYKEFIKKHGHRCMKEAELRSLPWELNPQVLAAVLQMSVKNWKPKAQKQQLTPSEAVEKLISPISKSRKRLMKIIVPFCHTKIRRREQSKSLLVRVLHMFRKAYITLGQQMVREGRIPEKDLIFFFTHSELRTMVQERSPGLLMKALQRRKLFVHVDSQHFPELSIGIPMPEKPSVNHVVRKSGVHIKGTPVCQGQVEGKAHVAVHLSDMDSVQHGDILIAYSTDIGWSPYFPILGGVVTEIGGLISHGAVVAREYGLPCIVGAENATALLTTGDHVLLDSIKGTVQKLNESVNQQHQAETFEMPFP